MTGLWGDEARAAREGAVGYRALDDDREIAVYPTIFGYRLVIGGKDADVYDDAWCFDAVSIVQLMTIVLEWDGKGDPPGRWKRHIGSGRRREYHSDGSLATEWVAR